MKDYYINECDRVCKQFKKADFSFALAADSHLDNSICDTLENIKAVDGKVGFDCLIHLGDFMNGNFPKGYTEMLLGEQTELWRAAVNAPFYPAEGNHDGYTENGINDMATDELWCGATKYLDDDRRVTRPYGKPYYYVDFEDKKIRLVFICSFYYEWKDGVFDKKYGISEGQVEWLKNEGFNAPCGWTVMVFSHDTPFNDYFSPISEDNQRINGYAAFRALTDNAEKNGFTVAAWFLGHEHGDYNGVISGVTFIMTTCETAYVPSLWPMVGDGVFPERNLGTVTEDAWDAVSVDTKERKIHMVRFGAGEDREISY
mgnify:FL=1